MARMARLVVPNHPHHVTQRGNRRQRTFFSPDDYRTYLHLLSEAKARSGVAVWAYCLMPNHVHLIVVPEREDGLRALFSDAHRRYTRHVNFREGWRGHLWQERFHSFVMDEVHLMAAVRYVELNPVRAGLCDTPDQWPWSSARAHLKAQDDALVDVAPMRTRISDWVAYLGDETGISSIDTIRKHTRSGRPAGSEPFIAQLEHWAQRPLRPKKPGPVGGD